MTSIYGIVLAAGKGTRMKSTLYKVLHTVCGKPMVEHVVEQMEQLHAEQIVTIVGHGAEHVQAHLKDRATYVLQKEQLGTGHAVLQAESVLKDKEGITLVICGDTPLLTSETLKKLIEVHEAKQAKATILTAYTQNPAGYGRIVRDAEGFVEKNVEHKDANEKELAICEINTGTYCFDNRLLFEALSQVTNDNAQGEYYLPDVLHILKQKGEIVAAYQMECFDEALGVNDRVALSKAEAYMRQRINEMHMLNGVTIVDPSTTYIEAGVSIGSDTVIEPGVMIKGKTTIGNHCHIGAHSVIRDSILEDEVAIYSSSIEESVMKKRSNAGPFAHLRPNSHIGEEVHIGNFVEVKNSTLGRGTKAGHLTYIGDADLGSHINIGCGTIFVNYDGQKKHRSTVEDHVFIGCNANIVSPVHIEESSYVAAGSTITKNIPSGALAISRTKQENKEGYVRRLKNK